MYSCIVDGGLMWAGQYPAVNQEKYETRDIKDNSKGGGTSPPSNHIFKVKEQKN